MALGCPSGQLSYQELDTLASKAANTLAELGTKPGDRVAACLPNDLDIVVAFHAVMRLGAIWVGVNQALALPEKAYLLSDSGASLLLTDSITRERLQSQGLLPDGLRVMLVPDEPPFADEMQAASSQRPAIRIDPDAPAALAYTSGTTGLPKAAVHSQANLLLPGAVLTRLRGWGPELRKGDFFALTIVNMMVLTTLLTAQAGGCSIITGATSARELARWIRHEQITVWNGPPALLYSMAHDEAIMPEDLSSLSEVLSGGGDLPERVREAFHAKFQKPVVATYGLSEAPTIVAIEDPRLAHIPGSSGKVLPHLEVTISNDDGKVLGTGAEGEICVSAAQPQQGEVEHGPGTNEVPERSEAAPWPYTTMLGYWNQPEASKAALAGGVLHTGDIGRLDEDGNLFVTDRKSLVIIRGGANVYPAEVERVLAELEEIQAAAVFGVPDERLGERVMAAVQPRAATKVNPQFIISYLSERLARYKVPEEIFVVEELPRNVMGKIERKKLSELVMKARPVEGPTSRGPDQ
jgi:acyl-CoA synthetase (AMP-forming)/AMP-acid ligase II